MSAMQVGAVETVEEPTPLGNEVLLAPVVSGLCSTDVHIYYEGALVQDLPLTMGHEFVGEVLEAPRSHPWATYDTRGESLQVGDLVCVEPMLPCNTCYTCLRGRPNLCGRMTHLGISAPGCWADLVSVPIMRAVRVTEGLSAREAIFVEPLACALHFVDKAKLSPGRSVLVLGAGPAGLLTAKAAKAAGAQVIVSDPNAVRREMARTAGADSVLDPFTEDLSQAVAALTRGVGVDAVIEIAGNPMAVAQAIDVAAPGSTVVLAGVCGQTHTEIDTNAIVMRELTVTGAVASRWHFARAMDLIASGAIEVQSLVSRTGHWSDADALLNVARNELDVCKILLDHG